MALPMIIFLFGREPIKAVAKEQPSVFSSKISFRGFSLEIIPVQTEAIEAKLTTASPCLSRDFSFSCSYKYLFSLLFIVNSINPLAKGDVHVEQIFCHRGSVTLAEVYVSKRNAIEGAFETQRAL